MENIQKDYAGYLLTKRKIAKKIKIKKILMPLSLWFDGRYNLRGKTVLDVGSLVKSSIFQKFVSDNSSDTNGYYGFDIDSASVDWLRSSACYFDIYDKQNNENIFDYIFMVDVYEHLTPDERIEILPICNKLLKDNGVLYIAFPNMENLNYFINGIADWTHKNVCIKSGSEVAALIEFGNFRFKDIAVYLGGFTMPFLSFVDNLLAILRNLICLYPPYHVVIITAKKTLIQT